jgi:hypothetical protein
MHFSSGASPIEIRTSVTHRTQIYEEHVCFKLKLKSYKLILWTIIYIYMCVCVCVCVCS